MAGVIDQDGVQWEHCNQCGDFCYIGDLRHAKSPAWPDFDKVDLCPDCYHINELNGLYED